MKTIHTLPSVLLVIVSFSVVGCGGGSANAEDDQSAGALHGSGDSQSRGSDSYDCEERDSKPVGATLTFDADHKLKTAVLKHVPYRGFAASQTFQADRGETTTGQNSEQEFTHVTWPVSGAPMPLEVNLSYLTKVKTDGNWKSISLDESLVGEFHAESGAPYGKLRVDVSNPDSDVGSSYFLFCTHH